MPDPNSFTEFVTARSRSLLRSAWMLTGDWASAHDLVQSALEVAWSRWDQLDDQGAPDRYVRSVIVSVYLRGRRRRWSGELPTDRVPEPAPSADAIAAADLRESMRVVLSDLAPRQRVAVVLRYFDDLSEADAAAVMGCSISAVKTHTARGLARLRSIPSITDLANT